VPRVNAPPNQAWVGGRRAHVHVLRNELYAVTQAAVSLMRAVRFCGPAIRTPSLGSPPRKPVCSSLDPLVFGMGSVATQAYRRTGPWA